MYVDAALACFSTQVCFIGRLIVHTDAPAPSPPPLSSDSHMSPNLQKVWDVWQTWWSLMNDASSWAAVAAASAAAAAGLETGGVFLWTAACWSRQVYHSFNSSLFSFSWVCLNFSLWLLITRWSSVTQTTKNSTLSTFRRPCIIIQSFDMLVLFVNSAKAPGSG